MFLPRPAGHGGVSPDIVNVVDLESRFPVWLETAADLTGWSWERVEGWSEWRWGHLDIWELRRVRGLLELSERERQRIREGQTEREHVPEAPVNRMKNSGNQGPGPVRRMGPEVPRRLTGEDMRVRMLTQLDVGMTWRPTNSSSDREMTVY